ncbi:steroid 17-alpha-hydroxylase/17,20 lyase-like [Oppia nitens]|uniref:steroid 17-alpha-hydroxylase/17,20 lyase-like n=1 Tax=Oppia nitens TaxID=1686743 RepID=UPI0023DBCFA3|nr:steroid 17-alpha-hydroxylase/17,20 lyase-like [Oppia nitens]
MRKLAKKYGPIFTVYLGNSPQIIVTDPVIARDVFNKSDFAGRTETYLVKLIGDGVIMADYGPNWETRRLVAHAAVKKYSKNERLVNVVVDCVDKTVETMLKTSIERDFCDTLIAAKNNALRDVEQGEGGSKQSLAKYLTDDKLGMTVLDVFFAGNDTSYTTFQWLLLFLANDLVVQKKLRKDISDKIGDRLPTLDDRHRYSEMLFP